MSRGVHPSLTGKKHAHAARGRDTDRYEVARRRMVNEQLVASGIHDVKVLATMGKVRRHLFVGRGLEDQAYLDRPLPIGEGQTISQPLIVATMTEALALTGAERILEIGTGCGYQTAILAELVRHVYTIERIAALSIHARKVVYRLEYKNVTFRVGDGTLGWSEEAPFDGIIVTAGAPVVPESLGAQLVEGGRLVIPVGGAESQDLLRVTRRGAKLVTERITGCRFVRLVGNQGWKEER